MEIKKRVEYVHLSDEQREDLKAMPTFEQVRQAIEADQRRFNALSAEEQQRELAEDAARREAERLARTCEHCGCDPDEHGGY